MLQMLQLKRTQQKGGGSRKEEGQALPFAFPSAQRVSCSDYAFRIGEKKPRVGAAFSGGGEGGIARLSHCLCESLVPKRMRFGTAIELGFVGVPCNR